MLGELEDADVSFVSQSECWFLPGSRLGRMQALYNPMQRLNVRCKSCTSHMALSPRICLVDHALHCRSTSSKGSQQRLQSSWQRQRQQLLANVPEESRAQINEQMLGVATGVSLCHTS